jgi:predicted enzyme related to lactoylglutathione lyase
MHTITHIEIPAPDLKKAVTFYSKVFDWKVQVIHENGYAIFKVGDTNTGGGLDASLKPAPEKTGHQVVINVDNIPEKIKMIEKEGGELIVGKTDIGGGHGFFAVFKDINGNLLQIHSRT